MINSRQGECSIWTVENTFTSSKQLEIMMLRAHTHTHTRLDSRSELLEFLGCWRSESFDFHCL